MRLRDARAPVRTRRARALPDPPPELRRGRSLRNRSSGAWGEELALRYLTKKGYTLVERNYRTRYGELDLVVRRGTTLILMH